MRTTPRRGSAPSSRSAPLPGRARNRAAPARGGRDLKAVRFHEHGGPEKLQLEDVPEPVPGPGDVVLRVGACALNHVDVDVREGTSRFPVPLPHTLGIEMVGTIEEVGPVVERWKRGDRVLPYLFVTCGQCRFCRTGRENLCLSSGLLSLATDGGYAEAMRCPASHLIAAPPGLSDVEAAAVPIAFATAWHMLFTRANLGAGESVLVNSVGSGIGSAAVQLAKLAGAFVIGTASSDEKLARAAELGLDAGVNYRKQDVVAEVMRATGGQGVDIVYEHAGGQSFQWGLDALSKDGRMVVAGGHAGEVVPFDIIPFFRGQKSIIGSAAFTRDEVEKALDLARRGLVKPVVYKVFPLAQAREAMETVERREHFGKIVLTP